MNMSIHNNYNNFDMYRNKTGIFLPFTGVDHAFSLHRPKHVRQTTEVPELINE